MATSRDVFLWIGRNGKRVGITVAGFSLIVLGAVMLVLPGPGLLTIVAGLAVLATEYAWAERALASAKRRARAAAAKARSKVKRRSRSDG
jgi:uncharacterized protein (TIGR02611 family)